MKAILEFDLTDPEDREEHLFALNGRKHHSFLFEVEQRIFRPHRKHGYGGSVAADKLEQLLNNNEDAREAISLLEELYFDLKRDYLPEMED